MFGHVLELIVTILMETIFVLLVAFVVRALLEKLFTLAVMVHVSRTPDFTSHYSATVFGLVRLNTAICCDTSPLAIVGVC